VEGLARNAVGRLRGLFCSGQKLMADWENTPGAVRLEVASQFDVEAALRRHLAR